MAIFSSGRACAYNEIRDFSAALRDLDQTISLGYDDWDIHFVRGQCHQGLGKYSAAVSDFGRAIQHEPEYVMPHFYRGLTFLKLKDYVSAVADFTTVIRLMPDAIIYFERGKAHFYMGNTATALDDFTSCIRLDPDKAEAYEGRGHCNLLLGRPGAALADYNRGALLGLEFGADLLGSWRCTCGPAKLWRCDFKSEFEQSSFSQTIQILTKSARQSTKRSATCGRRETTETERRD